MGEGDALYSGFDDGGCLDRERRAGAAKLIDELVSRSQQVLDDVDDQIDGNV